MRVLDKYKPAAIMWCHACSGCDSLLPKMRNSTGLKLTKLCLFLGRQSLANFKFRKIAMGLKKSK
jgi:hypothetical protein